LLKIFLVKKYWSKNVFWPKMFYFAKNVFCPNKFLYKNVYFLCQKCFI